LECVRELPGRIPSFSKQAAPNDKPAGQEKQLARACAAVGSNENLASAEEA